MKTYSIAYKYSNDGNTWFSTTDSVIAESDMGAIMQIQSKYPYVKNVRIISAR